ncbi:hypothetical protein JCM8202v2_004621 [Rhodotorula sphaerocarpa]
MSPTPGATGLMVPPAGWESKMGQPQPSPSSSANGHARRGSLLANDAMNWDDDAEPAWPSTPNTSQHFGHGARPSSAGGSGPGNAASAVDEGMSMSPMGAPSALSQHYSAHGPPSSSSSTATSAALPRQMRSRSGSASNAMVVNPAVPTALPSSLYPSFPAVPPSPVTIARALQVGQKTPPPFLARRLFKDGDASMQEESNSASGRSSRSGSSSDTTAPSAISAGAGSTGTSSGGVHAPRPRMTRATTTMATTHTPDEDEEIEELSAVLSRSASAGPEDPFERVVRRPVSRKPNLLPKTKSHLRVLTELKTESSGDQAEIASEATLFRLSRAGAVTVPGMRSSCPGSSALDPSRTHAHAPSSGHASTAGTRSLPGSGSRPPPNRFPEQIEEDDILSSHRAQSSSSSNDGEMDEVAEAGSDWGAMSIGGYGTEEEEERRSNIVWNGIRGGPGGSAVTVATPTGSTRSPNGSASRGMETDIPFAAPQTPSVSAGTRRSKRKLNDDRFEPYAHQAFKRRAVSPAASLSLSPGFGPSTTHSATSTSSSSRPTPPPPLGNSSLSTSTLPATSSQPVAIPSPPSEISHHQFFSTVSGAGTRSVANSPSATASSLSSSTGGGLGRGFMSFALSDRHRPISAVEEREREPAAFATEDVGRMSLGAQPDIEEEEL